MLDKTADGALCPDGTVMPMSEWNAEKRQPRYSVDICQEYQNGMVLMTLAVPAEAAEAILVFLQHL